MFEFFQRQGIKEIFSQMFNEGLVKLYESVLDENMVISINTEKWQMKKTIKIMELKKSINFSRFTLIYQIWWSIVYINREDILISSYFISNIVFMQEGIASVEKSDLLTFQKYLGNFWMFLQVNPEVLTEQLSDGKNQGNLTSFGINYEIRFMIMQKSKEGKVSVELEWTQDMLSSSNILLIKKNNFNLYKDIAQFKISEMIQVVNLDFQNESDPLNVSYQYINKLMMPLLGLYRNDFEKKSTSDKNSFINIMRKVNELNFSFAQCQEMVTVPQVKIEVHQKIKDIISAKEADKYLDDPDLLSQEQVTAFGEDVVKWNRDIESLLKTQFDLMSSTTMQEKLFWNSYVTSLRDLESQIQGEGVKFCIGILKKKNKFHLTASFDAIYASSKKKVESTTEINRFFKELNIQDMMSAQSMEDLNNVIGGIILNIRRIVNIDYETRRTYQFIEILSKDLTNQILKILGQENLMFCSFQDFKNWHEKANEIFRKYDDHVSFFMSKTRGPTLTGIITSATAHHKTNLHYTPLKELLNKLFEIRELHQKLKTVIEDIISKSSDKGFLSIKDIEEGYNSFKGINVLDLSKEGSDALDRSYKDFSHHIDLAETYITKRLREKLGGATNANEMFRIFSKFNGLYFRPRIKSAIEEYQSQLLKTVKDGIGFLEKKYVQKYEKTENRKICRVRDIPENPGKIIWVKQIRLKLEKYEQKIEQILMENWKEHPEGKQIKMKIDALLRNLNSEQFKKDWDKETIGQIRTIDLNKKTLFKVEKKNKHQVAVNFEPNHIQLIKEIKTFESIQPRSNSAIYTGKSLLEHYPHVVSLEGSIYSYHQVSAKIDDRIMKLLAEKKKNVMTALEDGFKVTWKESLRMIDKYSKSLAEVVLELHELQSLVSQKYEIIITTIKSMATCPLKQEIFEEKLRDIQEIINDFIGRNVSNLHIWVPELNEQLEAIFAKRVEALIEEWIKEFLNFREIDDQEEGPIHIKEGMRHDLKAENNVFFLDPPLEHAKFCWMQEFHRTIGIICSLPRLEADQYSLSLGNKEKRGDENYENVLFKIDEKIIQKAYDQIFKVFKDAEEYLKNWYNYESLWSIDSKKIYEKLGDDISLWQKLLNEIRENRKTFDNSQTEKYFGPIIVNYSFVLTRISTKYDFWHNEIINHFGSKFGDTLKSFFANCQNARGKLEKINFTNISVDIVDMVNEFQIIKKKNLEWTKEVEKFDSSAKLLERQRYKYPTDWLEIDKVMQEWGSFKQIFKRKTEQLDNEIPRLQDKVRSDERQINEKIRQIENQWNREKPNSSADIHPRDALSVLDVLSSRINNVRDSYEKCCQAKDLLNLPPGDTQRLDNLKEDIELLQEVWNHLQVIWEPYENIRETLITAITHSKMQKIEASAINLLNNTPAKLKSNEPFEAMKNKINMPKGTYYLMNKKIMELKEEWMKPRHWKILLSKLHINVSQNEVTFGKLWKADLMRNDPIFTEITTIAKGENVLERMLAKVKERWLPRELELVRYQGKCNLIKGWDEMFDFLDEDLNNLSSMKLSQYYKTFEEEIAQWDDKLQKMKIILDIWIDVQRRWVYLESIFLGSSDIKDMLVNEYSRFKSIDSEFTSLMKKVSSKPNLMETMSIQSLQKTLERLGEMLANIQKALGDYLETQRAAFARFYFIGDEDLLEIIGNSKDVAIVQKHFTKMYAGITSLHNEKVEGQDLIHTMSSREGEMVIFKDQVNITEDPKINIWLTKVDNEMRITLATYLENVMGEITELEEAEKSMDEGLLKIIEDNPAQVVLLGLQTLWSKKVDTALQEGGGQQLEKVEKYVMNFLSLLASNVVGSGLKKDLRQKFEQAITDFVHQRDVVRKLMKNKVDSNKVFAWLYFMRMIYFPKEQDTLKKLSIQMANASFHYGFEYLGVGEKLVQTPLTDRCFLTLTQALHLRMGGAPFGPAGTGKTESVKALGSQLGRFVLVFNCDETFDFHAMGRIFIGLCQVGAWGCFDEFNRLEERMLSACSQQILVIQTGLRERLNKIELMGKQVKLNQQVGCFVTMNPGYAGRSNLPENLKQLFRQMAMVTPDKELIAQVMLYSQGYKTAEQLAGKIVSLFDLCKDQLSSQPHYDFGLRALKSVLISSGNMKREEIKILIEKEIDTNAMKGRQLEDFEQRILLRSVCETIVPKLIADDIPLLSNLLQGVFPGSSIPSIQEPELRENIVRVSKQFLIKPEETFLEKVLQLYQIQRLHHGLMMVGPSGCGKTKAWQVLLNAMERTDKIKGESYVIDPKAINKDELYGKLDSTTLEWTDGVFTGVLRKITENQRGESAKRHWIIFDGDVDPEWAENLNSVLDDNKLLTLPNGERIQIPPNVRIMFEVQTLKYATLATVSRCGMVWFSEEVISPKMIFSYYLQRLKLEDYDKSPKMTVEREKNEEKFDPTVFTRERCVEVIQPLFLGDYTTFGEQALEIVSTMAHVMEFTIIRVVEATMALIRKGISNVLEYNESHPELPLEDEILLKYMRKWTVQAIMWGFGGSMTLREREKLSKKLADIINTHDVSLPAMLHQVEGSAGVPYILIDFEVRIEDGEWQLWKKSVPTVEIDPQKVTDADVIIPTVDTIRHKEILCSWLSEHRPFILCGPPGSGKTMTLMSTLKALPDFEMIFVNFSSSTSPSLIMKQFEHYCEYVKTVSGVVLRPKQPSKWLVVFCDEINLPDADRYGTMTVITFLRQLTEQHGFWRTSDRQWISLERIQFVGACNPPTDIGRKPLNPRFLRHCPLILVDFPGFDSLKQIFGTFNKAMLKRSLSLRNFSDCLTNAMVEFYTESQKHFTADIQPHYIYSPRQLTRWKYAINEAIETIDTIEDLVRLWAHEAMRLFEDRLVLSDEKLWCENLIDEVANRNFPSLSSNCLERPILFSNYLTKNYVSVDQHQLKTYIEARLKIFYEEQLNVPIVVFDEVLEHILRIDRVLRQPLGHLLLVGASGVGKTTLSRFVSWMNNISVFQIKAGRNYSLHDFDEDLRTVMKRAGVKQERICFIFDESNCLSPAFLEKMNALLASGEIPGLFEGEEYMLLLSQFKEHNSKGMASDDEIYRVFIRNVQRNLHVVFTMNPSNPDFSNRTASSPALFNRCVIDWFGDWSEEGLLQVAKQFTHVIDPVMESFENPVEEDEQRHSIVINTIVGVHNTVRQLNRKLSKSAKKFNYITPRDFLDFIKHFVELYNEKKSMLEDQQFHLNVGLDKLKQTESQVMEMRSSLDAKKVELEAKEKEASQKMTLIVQEKTKAKEKQEESSKLKIILEEKKEQISEKKQIVQKELSEALPALEAAKKNVENIARKDLDFIKGLAQPPEKVHLAMKPIFYMIQKSLKTKEKGKDVQWSEIRSLMQRDFIKQVQQLKADDIPENVKNYVLTEYLNTPQFDLEAISKASSAAGALASWAKSQLSYADILTKVNPMRNEIIELEEEEQRLVTRAQELSDTIEELERKTKQLEIEYENLIKEKQEIVADMSKVEDKVSRSINLLRNLSSEKYRWEDTSKNFKNQLASMLGDVFLSSAFLAYIGFFDHYYRKLLSGVWRTNLEVSKIKYRQELSIIEFISSPSERLIWKSHRLPSDDLCTENAIIMKRYHKYPLIIDPAGQAIEYLTSLLTEKNFILSSFADDAFLKNLEKSIRFGRPLIVQDVEKIEPILNSVLNKEVYKTGGMTLIRVGDQEIDFNPNFSMFMITRNSNAKFTPDLCSRVTFVNFTITPSSLEEQCLNIFLKNERPDVEEKRISLMKIQGEYIVKLRELEDSLLDALSNVQGSILESESVISTLEKLKTEATKITEEMKRSDEVMGEVDSVTNGYRCIAEASSKIFFALQSMSGLHYLYEYSLNFFMDTVMKLLESEDRLNKISKKDYDLRKDTIHNLLFEKIFQRVSNSLLSNDLLILSLKLVHIKLPENLKELFGLLIKPTTIMNTTLSKHLLEALLTEDQLKQIEEISSHEFFSDLVNTIENNEGEWMKFLIANNPEEIVPDLKVDCNEMTKKFINLILIKIFRPDKFSPVAYETVKEVLGEECKEGLALDLKNVVANCKSKEPILLSSAPGFDPSYKVQQMSKEVNMKLYSVAIGSAEGFELADRSIKEGVKQGAWVMLKNVHLDPVWLSELEKKIHVLNPHQNFRLFLTAEFSPKIPSTLIRQSFKLVFEPAAGIKASLLRTYKTVLSPSRSDKTPVERSRLHFLLAWLHAVICERLRYIPIGWTKVYEFNEADQRCALDLIDEFIDSFGNRNNIDIEKIPWDAFRTILIENLYGGKVDNEYDSKILVSLVQMFFTPKSFDSEYPLYRSEDPNETPFTMPDGIRYSQFLSWVQKLPNVESPAWSGLPNNVEKILKSQQTSRTVNKLYQLQDVNEEQVTLEKKKEDKKNKQVKWLSDVNEKVIKYLEILPKEISKLARTEDNMNNPLFRFLEREVTVASKLLGKIDKNCADTLDLCNGKILATNVLRDLAQDIHADAIPKTWVSFIMDPTITLTSYVMDLQKRFNQFNKLIQTPDYQNSGVWFGGLLFPEAYMTATRQFVAQRNGWSLEELELRAVRYDNQKLDQESLLVTGMRIEGGKWSEDNVIVPINENEEIGCSLPDMLLTWERTQDKTPQDDQMMVPVYLNRTRKNLILSLRLNCGEKKTLLYQKGIALIAWTL